MKKAEKLRLIIFSVLAIGLVISIVFNVITVVKLNKIEGDYAVLSTNYENIGKEMLAEKNNANNYRAEVEILNSDKEALEKKLSEYEKALKYATENIYVSENHYMSGQSINIFKAVAGDEINVDPQMYYAAYSPEEDIDICAFTKSGKDTPEVFKCEAGKATFLSFPEDCEFITCDDNPGNAILVSTGIAVSDNSIKEGSYFYVVSPDSPVKLSIADAVSMLNEHGTVLVFPGIYEEHIFTRDKEVNICGADRDSCIIRSYDNDYYNPPLEISAGKVSDISIQTLDDGRGLNTKYLAYAVHADFDYMYGRDLTFENCNLISEYNAGAGIGLRGEGTLTFRNCSLTGYYHGLFVHDSKDTKVGGRQNLVLDSCTINGINGDVALVLSSCIVDDENAYVDVLFKDNELGNLYTPESDNLFAAVNEDLSKHDGYYMELKNFHLNEESKGNNVPELNY